MTPDRPRGTPGIATREPTGSTNGRVPRVRTNLYEHPELFWSRVDKTGSRRRGMPSRCWTWIGASHEDGYGRVWDGSRVAGAHRVAYALSISDPGSLCVLHKCDNPRCCRPSHLFLGTRGENNTDTARKGRTAFGDRNGTRLHPEAVPRGDKHYRRQQQQPVDGDENACR